MKDKKNAFIIIIIAAAIFTTGTIIFDFQPANDTQPANQKVKIEQTEEESATLSIDFGNKKETFKASPRENTTVYDFLKRATDKKDIQLKTKKHEFGIMITQIGEKKNTEDGKNWLFYVNGEMAKKAVDKVKLESGDKVEFKYEENPF